MLIARNFFYFRHKKKDRMTHFNITVVGRDNRRRIAYKEIQENVIMFFLKATHANNLECCHTFLLTDVFRIM